MGKTGPSAKPQVSLRKSPKQERSKDLVEAVMGAATRILESAGIDHVTTNKIAERAGISIGSLYQYFPGKDAIFSMMIEKQIEENSAQVRELTKNSKNQTAAEFIGVLVSFSVDFFFEKRVFIAALFSEVPKLKKTREVLARRNILHQVFVEFLTEHPDELKSRENIELQVYVLAHAIIGVLQTAVLENFETHTPDALKTETTRMARAYLLR